MDARIVEFLTKERVAVLSVLTPKQTLHGATIHFVYDPSTNQLFFNTKKESRKCQLLAEGKSASAAVVVGFSEIDWKELQLDGEARIEADEQALERIKPLFLSKYPTHEKHVRDSSRVFVAFTPSWYRYTEFRTEPRVHIEENYSAGGT